MAPRLLTQFISFLLFMVSLNSYADTIEVNLLFIGDTEGSAFNGVSQGVEEANTQGKFLGQEYTLNTTTMDTIDGVESSNVIAVFVASNKKNLLNVVELFPNHPVFNLNLDNDELRSNCHDNLLSTSISAAMKQDAIAQWQQKKPESQAAPQAWHDSFVKYAASQLNERFEKQQGVKMDDEAYSGWAAAKMVSDAVARDNIQESAKMLDFLKNKLVFDGQKGINMTFKKTGQLRQPILMIENDKIVAEAPVRGVVDTSDLDTLGIADCSK